MGGNGGSTHSTKLEKAASEAHHRGGGHVACGLAWELEHRTEIEVRWQHGRRARGPRVPVSRSHRPRIDERDETDAK
jgi:hypothetical protein